MEDCLMNEKGTLSLAILLLAGLVLILTGCKNRDEPVAEAVGQLLNYEGCKSSPAGDPSALAAARQDCLDYSYDGATLRLKHVNAGFNCCPGEISAVIRVAKNAIIIKESEAMAGCYCKCLFDIDYLIENLFPGQYTIQVDEPYIGDGDAPLALSVLLEPGASATFCVERNHYPWDIDPDQ